MHIISSWLFGGALEAKKDKFAFRSLAPLSGHLEMILPDEVT